MRAMSFTNPYWKILVQKLLNKISNLFEIPQSMFKMTIFECLSIAVSITTISALMPV